MRSGVGSNDTGTRRQTPSALSTRVPPGEAEGTRGWIHFALTQPVPALVVASTSTPSALRWGAAVSIQMLQRPLLPP